jgi:hypothetical protein
MSSMIGCHGCVPSSSSDESDSGSAGGGGGCAFGSTGGGGSIGGTVSVCGYKSSALIIQYISLTYHEF